VLLNFGDVPSFFVCVIAQLLVVLSERGLPLYGCSCYSHCMLHVLIVAVCVEIVLTEGVPHLDVLSTPMAFVEVRASIDDASSLQTGKVMH
jgi:hypothetical protein